MGDARFRLLYPFSLRDTLLRAAAAALFQVYWSDEILEETRRNLVKSAAVPEGSAARLIATMNAAFPEARVTGYESLVASMRNDPKDAHVAAAAVKAGAQVIVTSNLADFRDLPEGIEAQSPDEFLGNLFDLDRDGLLDLLREQAAVPARWRGRTRAPRPTEPPRRAPWDSAARARRSARHALTLRDAA